MPPRTPRLVVPVDLKKQPWEQELPLHNRWHPRIPPVAEVKAGEFFRVEMMDWTGGIIRDNDSASDVNIWTSQLLNQVHYLSGPIKVLDEEGVPAQPGDLLAVEICNLGPLPGDEWGYTATFDRENGGGFLTDHFPCATKAIWFFEGIYAYSPHIPGVRFPGLTHPGIIGTAPSKELLDIWNGRERDVEENGLKSLNLCEVLHSRPLANLPSPKGCLLGKVEKGTAEWDRIATRQQEQFQGERMEEIVTSRILAKGDGEVSFCGAIEMSGFLELKYPTSPPFLCTDVDNETE
ncbi:Formamidase [Bienertia sinuspersici]